MTTELLHVFATPDGPIHAYIDDTDQITLQAGGEPLAYLDPKDPLTTAADLGLLAEELLRPLAQRSARRSSAVAEARAVRTSMHCALFALGCAPKLSVSPAGEVVLVMSPDEARAITAKLRGVG